MSFWNRVKTFFSKKTYHCPGEELKTSHSPEKELGYKPIPTVRPAVPFNVDQPMGILREFIDSSDTNKEEFIEFFVRFSIDHDRFPYLCKHLHAALSGEQIDILTLVEILSHISHTDMTEILLCYKVMYGSLLEHIRERTFGKLCRLFSYLVTQVRSPPLLYDTDIARFEAQTMYDASNEKLAIDEDMLFYWMAENSFIKLRTRFEEYNKLWGHSIQQAIEREMGEDIKTALLAMGECNTNKCNYKTVGTNKIEDF